MLARSNGVKTARNARYTAFTATLGGRPVARPLAVAYARDSSRLTTFPVALRGSSDRKSTERGTL